MTLSRFTEDGNSIQIPGLASVHSHAFQRALRGMTQRKRSNVASFWSWRNAMYRLVERLDPESLYAVARLAYMELALSGVTMVGEFHYLHHQADGVLYSRRTELADTLIRAASDIGIRVCLIRAAYLRTGFKQTVAPAQKRFCDASLDEVIEDIEALKSRYADNPLVCVAAAAHSIRAVPIDDIVRLATWAARADLPFHMHVSEQRRELEECRAEYGITPLQLLAERGILNSRFVAIHATHLAADEIMHLGRAGSFVALCRTTERDLGDGLPPTLDLVRAGVRLCVGVDSHCGENAFEEMRAVELDARTQHEARTVVGDGKFLLDMGTAQGYEACGFGADLEDRVLLDRQDPSLIGLPEERLADSVVFNATPRAVRDVYVNGQRIIAEGRHPKAEEIMNAYTAILPRLRETNGA